MVRRRWRQWHLLLSLIAGAPLVLVSGTGLLMNYWFEADAILDPRFYPARQAVPAVPLDRQVDSVRARASGMWVSGVYLIDSGRVTHVWVAPGPDSAVTREYAVDPGTGRVLATRAPGEAVINAAYRLHSELLVTGAGRTLVSALALVLVVLLATGVALAWRRGGWEWLRPRWRREHAWRDVHQSVGLWSGGLLALAAVTAVLLQAIPGGAPPGAPPDANPAGRTGLAGSSLPLELLADRARAVRPGWRLVALEPIDAREAPLTAILERPPSIGGRRLLHQVQLVRTTGTVLREQAVGGSGVRALLVELHTGQVGGSAGRALLAGVALVPLLLWISGLVLWVRRRGAET